jgi:hypothetical protein
MTKNNQEDFVNQEHSQHIYAFSFQQSETTCESSVTLEVDLQDGDSFIFCSPVPFDLAEKEFEVEGCVDRNNKRCGNVLLTVPQTPEWCLENEVPAGTEAPLTPTPTTPAPTTPAPTQLRIVDACEVHEVPPYTPFDKTFTVSKVVSTSHGVLLDVNVAIEFYSSIPSELRARLRYVPSDGADPVTVTLWDGGYCADYHSATADDFANDHTLLQSVYLNDQSTEGKISDAAGGDCPLKWDFDYTIQGRTTQTNDLSVFNGMSATGRWDLMLDKQGGLDEDLSVQMAWRAFCLVVTYYQ